MPVDSKHPEYISTISKWRKCRDAVSGQERIHAESTTYLPQTSGMDSNDYDAYLTRTPFYNATGKTVEVFNSLIFRKEPEIIAPPVMSDFISDVNGDNESLTLFSRRVTRELFITSRCGIFVDYARAEIEGTITIAIAEMMNLQPILTLYTAEQIINWKTARVNNKTVLTMVVLEEEYTEERDEFELKAEVQYRVLDIDEEGYYRIRIFRKNGDSGSWQSINEDYYPLMNNSKMREIPFVFLSSEGTTAAITKPMLIDLVNINIAHYQTMADRQHAAHFTALPTPTAIGYDAETQGVLRIGSATVLTSSNPQTQFGMLEYTGQGINALNDILERFENYMANLGARLLAAEKKGVEAAETAKINRAGESATVSAMSKNAAAGIVKALEIAAMWLKASGEISLTLNDDYIPIPLTAQELTALVSAWQTGAMSYETFFHNLKLGEMTIPGRTAEEEKAVIEASEPVGMAASEEMNA